MSVANARALFSNNSDINFRDIARTAVKRGYVSALTDAKCFDAGPPLMPIRGNDGALRYRQNCELSAYQNKPNRNCSNTEDATACRAASREGSRLLSAWCCAVVCWTGSLGKHRCVNTLTKVEARALLEHVTKLAAKHKLLGRRRPSKLLIKGKAQSLEVHIEGICQ